MPKLIRIIGLILVVTCFSQFSFSQENTGTIKGTVIDSSSAKPLSSATITVFTQDNKKLSESISTAEGAFSFQVPLGSYKVEIGFTGYKKFSSSFIRLNSANKNYDFKEISLTPAASVLDEVVVQAEKSSMQLSLDKRIFNVGKDLANAGGSASDILMNIPSVSVDPEGNVKLRGSDNVRILIDGKPSGLVSFKGGSGLQQLQASMVERVEIITNPSARYEAEGMAGVLNIVLKKDKRQGFNGSFEVTTGTPTNLGAAANLNYRHKKINFFINYGIAYRRTPGRGRQYQEVFNKDSVSILRQANDGRIRGFNNNIRGGLDYYFTEKSILTASYLFEEAMQIALQIFSIGIFYSMRAIQLVLPTAGRMKMR